MPSSTLVVDLLVSFAGIVVGFLFVGLGRRAAAPSDRTKRLIAVSRLPLTLPSLIKDGMEIKVRGRVAPGEALVTSPLTGRAAVMFIATASFYEGDDVALDSASRPFRLDCESGVRVSIQPKGCELLGTPEWLLVGHHHVSHVFGALVKGRATHEQVQWARSRLAGATDLTHLVENIVQPGQEVVAVGRVRFDGHVPTLDGSAPGGLTITACSDAIVRDAVEGRRTVGRVIAGTGLLVVVGSLAWGLWVAFS